jgi:putative two-component system response regulator
MDPAVHDQTPQILVVDDEPSLRKIIARWLTEAGYACAEAAGAVAALDYLEGHPVGLVTLDLTMPVQSGMQLLPQIKQRWPETEVIILTAVQETATAIEALTLGAYGYLIKPLEAEDMVLQAKKALERRQLLLERQEYTRTLEAKVREQTIAIRRAHEETILRLVSASRYRDEETGAHVRRTGLYCELFAEVLGWPAQRVEEIRMAAPMHDLGKIGIPDAILLKPGRLSGEEFQVMKSHTLIGARMLDRSESAILQMAHKIALSHHEYWNGGGYPRGLSGMAIPEEARILSLVDVYDALTHRRVYREALPEAEALSLLEEGRGSQFDPFLLGIFLSLVPEMRRIAEDNPEEGSEGGVLAADELSAALAILAPQQPPFSSGNAPSA